MAPSPSEKTPGVVPQPWVKNTWLRKPSQVEVEATLDLYFPGQWERDPRKSSRPRYWIETPMGAVWCRTVGEAWLFIVGYETARMNGGA